MRVRINIIVGQCPISHKMERFLFNNQYLASSMYIKIYENNKGIRSGKYSLNGKSVRTPVSFAISDIGGGAGSVDRFVSYIDMIYSQNIPILMNYYYLTRGGSISIKWVQGISKDENILDFLSRINGTWNKSGKISSSYLPHQTKNMAPLVMLDSGSGNFVRDFAGKGSKKDIIDRFKSTIKEYYEYAASHKFDILVALDYALKMTKKGGESSNQYYNDTIRQLREENENLNILSESLTKYKDGGYPFMLFAPIHGETPSDISRNLQQILEVEDNVGAKFSGFAITFPSDRTYQGLSRENFIQCIGYSARKVLRERGDLRPIHALGMGGAGNVLSLVSSGVDSYDSHTPWRRAMDGTNPSNQSSNNTSYSKFLNPLVNQNLDIIDHTSRALEYIPIINVPDKIISDCPVCMEYPIKEIKRLYFNEDKEDFYLSKMLIYLHSLLQSKYIGQAIVKASQDEDSFQQFFNMLPAKFRVLFSINNNCWNH